MSPHLSIALSEVNEAIDKATEPALKLDADARHHADGLAQYLYECRQKVNKEGAEWVSRELKELLRRLPEATNADYEDLTFKIYSILRPVCALCNASARIWSLLTRFISECPRSNTGWKRLLPILSGLGVWGCFRLCQTCSVCF